MKRLANLFAAASANPFMRQDSSARAQDSAPDTALRSALHSIWHSPDLRRMLPWIGLAALLANLLAVVLPMAMLQIMDRVVANKSLDTLFFLVLGILLAILLEEILRSMNGMITAWLGARFEHAMSNRALAHLLYMPLETYQKQESGSYSEKIQAASRVAEFYSGQALLVLFDLPFSLLFLGLIMFIGGPLAILPLILLMVFGLVVIRFARWLRQLIIERQNLDERRFSFLEEVLANIVSVKVMALEPQLQRRYERLEEANAGMGQSLTHANNLAASMGGLFAQLMIIGIIFGGSLLVMRGNMTPGALSACMMLSVRALQPLTRSLAVWLRYQLFIEARQRLDQILHQPVAQEMGRPALLPLQQNLRLQDVCMQKENGQTLFQHLSLELAAGECIAISGDSGSGKSCLLSLLNGSLRPAQGRVQIDGVDLHSFDVASVAQEIGLLAQRPTIFSGTVLENMTMFQPGLNREAQQIAVQLGLERIVAAMPMGYETRLSEGVTEIIPEGVRQLICMVRVMVQKPSVLLFDEANTSLDMDADRLLQNYLRSQQGKMAMVLVTHRPSLAALATRRLYLYDGALHTEAAPESVTPEIENHDHDIPPQPQQSESLEQFVQRHFQQSSDFSACLIPLLRALQWQEDRRELAEAIPHLSGQLDLTGLCMLMSNLAWQAHAFNSSLRELDARLLPVLYIPPHAPACVILARNEQGWLVWDAASQSEIVLPADERRQVACMLFRAGEIEHLTPANKSWIAELFWKQRRQVGTAFGLSLLATFLALAPPLFVASIYDRVIPAGDMRLGMLLLLGALLAVALEWRMRGLRSRIMAFFGGRSEFLLGIGIFDHIISLQTASMDGISVTRQLGRIKNLESLRDIFLGPLALLAFELPSSLILLLAIGLISPWLSLVVCCTAALFTVLGLISHHFGHAIAGNASNLVSERNEFLNELLSHMRALRNAGAQQAWLQRFRDLSGAAVMANFASNRRQALFNSCGQLLGVCAGVATLATSSLLAINGVLSGGAMIASMMIVWRLVGPMQGMFNAGMTLVRVRTTMRQIENLMHLKGERDGGARQAIRPQFQGNLNFQRVSFRYANDADPALLGINMKIDFGQFIIVTGPNGCGKSSLLKLVVRLYQPQAGQIRLDNADIRQLSAADLRARIAYMPQQCELFHGTVAQNLRLAHPGASDAEIDWALQMAGLSEDVAALAQGKHTRISNSSAELLPNGFRQRLSLARTILKPVNLVLLDEPGKGMDETGEQALLRCLNYWRGKATILMVSHRPGHMRLADLVLYMEHGAISAAGRFEQIKDKVLGGGRK
ncbi:ATP-binding cassette domain-containing protein [Massilia sp. W12]|uniref:peptidase domain-containing ABC transporter n=1 Tax=Massilia sp. W12 TaxID=3126507 RepID=UPI0030D36D9D